MGLVQVATNTVTSGVSYVDLIGTTTDDVYMITLSGVNVSTDQDLFSRVLKSSSPDTTSTYDGADKTLRNDTTFGNSGYQNQDHFFNDYLGDGVDEMGNMIFYLYNFNDSSEYSYLTVESCCVDNANPKLKGRQGGQAHTTASASNGMRYYVASGTITAGTFTLYKVT
ncbi:hypothetical protein N9O36_02025 [Acidimicrobiia bacterium]|nr:hypothetical protein [Acidimicrobiia bacterium]